MTKNISLLVLGIASLGLSRLVFLFMSDLEGPNLLVVMVLAAIIFVVSLAAYAVVHRFRRPGNVK
jgi:hypothetical protein